MLRPQPVAALLLATMTAIPLFNVLAAEAEEKPAPRPGTAGGWPELSEPAALERAQGVQEKLMLVSWGDLIFFYGPETDAGLYNREQIERMMSYWKRGGFTQVYWRSEDLPMPDWEWNRFTIYAEASFIKAEAEKIRKRENTTRAARELAGKMGMQFYFWHSIYDEGTPPGKKHRFWNAFPWRHTFFDENPGLETVDRNGDVQWGVPEMAYPAVRKRKIDQYLEFVQKYEPDFEGLESLGEHGYLDWRSGSQRYFIGDPRYHAGKNTSPGLAGPLTTDPAHSPALVDVSGLGGRGTAVCLREGGRAFEIIRRTGRDWPDDPISKGKAVLSFDIMRKSPAAFAVTTLLNQRYVGRLPAAAENNLQLKTNDSGSVSLWNGKEWSVAASTLPERSWVNLSMELDYEQGKCALKIDGQTAASEILDSSKQWFDATAFACETSEVYIDNISIRWSW